MTPLYSADYAEAFADPANAAATETAACEAMSVGTYCGSVKKSPRVAPRGKVGWWSVEKWHIGNANSRNEANQISMIKN